MQHKRTALLKALDKVEQLAVAGRFSRLLRHPLRYLTAVGFDKIVYPIRKQPLLARGKTFYGLPFKMELPAGTDIYLTGGKTHVSELRLSRFMLRYLDEDAHYADVGGHYGFFAGLAATLIQHGTVTVFEPAPDNFAILGKNLVHSQADIRQLGLADVEDRLTFYQFPARYSEYNSLDVEQYAGEDWIKDYPPTAIEVPITTLDNAFDTPPDWIKIDVEGAEDLVIKGGSDLLSGSDVVITMEYLPAHKSNGSHLRAAALLVGWGYQIHYLADDGTPSPCPGPENWLRNNGQDSANLVFCRTLPPALV